MRKVLKVLILLLIIATMGIVHVDAANSNIALVSSMSKVQIGSTFTVKINVTCNTGFEGLTGKLTFDNTKLELVGVENTQGFADLNTIDGAGKYDIAILPNTANTITSGTCQTITFRVLDNVNNKEQLNIKLEAQMKDGNEKVENIVSQVAVTVNEDIVVTSKNYNIESSKKYISNISPKTTVNTLKEKITTNATEVKIYNKEGKELNNLDKVGTNARIVLKNGNYDEQTFTLIVRGDIDGNGDADFWDMIAINKHRLGTQLLGEIEAFAGDVDGDGEIGFWDMIEINKFRLGLKTTL